MGEITVKGSAKKEVKCDLVKYRFEFKAEGTSVPESLKKVNDELEKFLATASKNGMEADNFKVESNGTREFYGNKNRTSYISTRIISAVFPMDSAFLNSIISLVSSDSINVLINEEYLISNEDEIHTELLRLAIDDSRKKAEMIASCAGAEIKGIKSLRAKPEEYAPYDMMRGDVPAVASACSLADKISEPTKEESETVEIVWNME